VLLMIFQIVARLLFPELAPPGITTTLLMIIFFGSINLLGISLLGEYLGKVFEEVKRRPLYIRRSVIRDGEVRRSDERDDPGKRPGS
jgi:polyisoprenyl-phosphate glycosyltransferase